MNTFNSEQEFENALIALLTTQYGWEPEVLRNPTEKDLLDNWAKILFENNKSIDRLGDYPLTEGEMQQIVEQINTRKTPLKLNGFINGKTIAITRDNPDDTLHLGKEISLKIYDKHERAGGQSRYQIAQQPKLPTSSAMTSNRRGDLMLLINGMPLIHIELKRSGIPVSQACNQIEKYAHAGIFSQGLFVLIQIFVAMNPEDMRYFANPGPEGKFNPNYFFTWGDFNNEPITQWNKVASSVLSIPMAHQLVGYYSIPDSTDGVLKVMRSYQYYAASALWDKVKLTKWADKNQYGGYIWHTTGSGKTMTSFKSAQLIANAKDADKVVFLMDRIELGTQSLEAYQNFADDSDSVQATENTNVLLTKLKDDKNPANTLIVTSIQKMSNIQEEAGVNEADIKKIRAMRVVFIIDEAHRSTFGDMLKIIKQTFPAAIFFGFTGTPITDENQKKMNTTSTIFGDELHKYTIADGIRDKNVLGFDPYKILTYRDRDLRTAVALEKARAHTIEEALDNEEKAQVYLKYMNDVPMAETTDEIGNLVEGIESYLGASQYNRPEHRNEVANDILNNWRTLSHNGKFHAILATSSIPEAMLYYRLFKEKNAALKVAALFDPSIDNNGTGIFKEESLVELITDYNARYNQQFTIPTFAKYKKDVSARLAHKKPYLGIERTTEKQIDLLIVVDQMLTGFDSKWLNTLYLDKLLQYENIIQAFSRTNRLFGPPKPFGTIRYYRKPHTMERRIEEAVRIYSGGKPLALFVDKLESNLNRMNSLFTEIKNIFQAAGIQNFERLPRDKSLKGQFARLFKTFNDYLEAVDIQGFTWDKLSYDFKSTGARKRTVTLILNETTYLTLALRYRELFSGGGGGGDEDVPYEIETHLTEINTDRIDVDYMNTRFIKYLKALHDINATDQARQSALAELHKTFATLTQDEQKYANIFLHDVERGDVELAVGKSLRDYITEYQVKAKDDQIRRFAIAIGIDESQLRNMMSLNLTEATIDEFGRFTQLITTINYDTAKQHLENESATTIPMTRVKIRAKALIHKFILEGGFEV